MELANINTRDILDQLTVRQLQEVEVLVLSKEYQDKIGGHMRQLSIDDPNKYFVEVSYLAPKSSRTNRLKRELQAFAQTQNATMLTGELAVDKFIKIAEQNFRELHDKYPRAKPLAMQTKKPANTPGSIYVPGVYQLNITRVVREK